MNLYTIHSKVLNGELEYAKFNKDSILAASEEVVPQVKLSASKEELELRNEVIKEEKNTDNSSKVNSKNSKQ
jgi:hypothetical protein